MKPTLLFLSLLFFVEANAADLSLGDLIHHEVEFILQQYPGLTVRQCTNICDAMFDMSDPADEQLTTELCQHACECEIRQNCEDHTHAPQPTNRPPVGR